MNVTNIKKIRSKLKANLLDNNKLHDFNKKRKEIYDLVKRTIDNGESNSVLLIGPRGVGKTGLMNNVLNQFRNSRTFDSNAVLVKLHGLIHTDDRLALKSATSQMNLENAVDGKVFGSFAENLAFLLACLRTGKRETSKAVVFIIEKFDLFCSHHNQTLLYNLFDVSQSAQTPICIIGITCRLDVVELLEKRVKSRFSHRQIFLFPGCEHSASLVDNKIVQVTSYLLLPETDKQVNLPLVVKRQWNKMIEGLIENKKFKAIMQRLVDVDTDEQTLKNILMIIVAQLSENKTLITVEDFELSLHDTDETVQMLQDLSVLELCLIIAMKHHTEIYDNQPMNFEMIFSRYIKFANANSNIQTVQRPVVIKAFEHLKNMELISMVNQSAGKMQNEYGLFRLLATPQQIQEAINKSTGLPTEVIQWVNSCFV